jgi:hypothetical protein
MEERMESRIRALSKCKAAFAGILPVGLGAKKKKARIRFHSSF